MTLNKQWTLPKPPSLPTTEWNPVVRIGRYIPFGYRQDPNDKDILLPIPDELDALEFAKKLLKEYSLREVAAWLSSETGREISHMGLKKRVDIEQKRRKASSIQRFYQRKAEEAAAKAEEYERKIGGSQTKVDPSESKSA